MEEMTWPSTLGLQEKMRAIARSLAQCSSHLNSNANVNLGIPGSVGQGRYNIVREKDQAIHGVIPQTGQRRTKRRSEVQAVTPMGEIPRRSFSITE